MAVMVNDSKDTQHFIAYKTGKPLARFSVLRSYLILPFSRKTAGHFFRFIGGVITNFFLIQQKQKIGSTHIPVVHVDHPLDEKIAFTPGKVKIYLDFVGFFIRIFSMLLKRLGLKTGLKYCADFFDFLTRLYKNAGSVYSQCLTTTDRPHYKKNLRFLVIHLFDPHLLCVPSLHVAIVAGCWAFVRDVFSQKDVFLSDEEKNSILEEIYGGAVAIIETVLYVKQHSINCVAAALYMLTFSEGKGFFSAADADKITGDLFALQDNVEASAKDEIRSYISGLYKKLASAGETSSSWQKPVLDFLRQYK